MNGRGGAGRQANLFADPLVSFRRPRHAHDRIGVVDVGSNSVRMVVFEGGRRCPALVFNEKILCGLGAELSETGCLAPEGMERALNALRRFVALAPGLRVGALAGIATAAVREARDGPEFRDLVEAETNIRLEIASGEDEARLAAQGVLFGDPKAQGLVIDLGGASMEFCPVWAGRTGAGVTTPLGPQLLEPLGSQKTARAEIERVLAPLAGRYRKAGDHLILVGGAWRALGRLQIHRLGHPLSVLHEFSFSADDAADLAEYVLGADTAELGDVPGMPGARVGTLAHAALLLDVLLQTFHPKALTLSGFGLREGVCYDHLPAPVRSRDPLLSTCEGQEHTRARAPGFGRELARWILAAVPPVDDAERRLIKAACHLADVSWRAHPDYRTTNCIEIVTRVNVSGAGHRGRILMAAMLLGRYKGGRKALAGEPSMALLTQDEQARAVAIGALMRLGCTISGATPGYLSHCPMVLDNGVLSLSPGGDAQVFMGEEVEKRLAQAARAFGATGVVRPT